MCCLASKFDWPVGKTAKVVQYVAARSGVLLGSELGVRLSCVRVARLELAGCKVPCVPLMMVDSSEGCAVDPSELDGVSVVRMLLARNFSKHA